MSPADHGAALLDAALLDAAVLDAIVLTRRDHDLVCTWGPESATFQYSRAGAADPVWEAAAAPSARSRFIGAAYLLAFADVTGTGTGTAPILPAVVGDSTQPSVRAAYLKSVFDFDAARQLTSSPIAAR